MTSSELLARATCLRVELPTLDDLARLDAGLHGRLIADDTDSALRMFHESFLRAVEGERARCVAHLQLGQACGGAVELAHDGVLEGVTVEAFADRYATAAAAASRNRRRANTEGTTS